jgi:Mg-chelatase subunit ChlD
MKDIIEIRKKQNDIYERLKKQSGSVSEFATIQGNAIALLLDVSGSMFGDKLDDAKESLINFIDNINLNEYEIGLIAFGGRIQSSKLSNDHLYLKRWINSYMADGATPLMEAIQTAHNKIKNKSNSIMIIATDGQPTDANEGQILEYANKIKISGIRIIVIGIGDDVNKDFLKELASSLEDYHFAKESFKLKQIYQEVANDILALPPGPNNSMIKK